MQGSSLTDEYEKNGLMFVEVPRIVHKRPLKTKRLPNFSRNFELHSYSFLYI